MYKCVLVSYAYSEIGYDLNEADFSRLNQIAMRIHKLHLK